MPTDVRRLVNISEAQQFLGCGRSQIYRLVREGKLTMVKLKSRSKVTMSSLVKLRDDLENEALGRPICPPTESSET
jgi:excisionase family DNA binding protein